MNDYVGNKEKIAGSSPVAGTRDIIVLNMFHIWKAKGIPEWKGNEGLHFCIF